MTQRADRRRSRRMVAALFLIFPTMALAGDEAIALSISLTQVGGTAIAGQGRVGDTIEVAVDVSIEADEAVTALFPTLMWDGEGGNVLDLRSARVTRGVTIGDALFSTLGSNVILTDSGAPGERHDRYFSDRANVADDATGMTLMLAFNLAPSVVNNDELLGQIFANGFPGPLSIRLGVATFRLASLGETTLGFYRDPESTLRTIVTGARGTLIQNGAIEFSEIAIAAVGFEGLRIMVVPEPGTALLVGLGLGWLAACRRPARNRSYTGAP